MIGSRPAPPPLRRARVAGEVDEDAARDLDLVVVLLLALVAPSAAMELGVDPRPGGEGFPSDSSPSHDD